MAKPINVAVLGTGALGSQHVRLYAELAKAGQVQVSGIYDQNRDAAKALATQYHVPAAESFEALVSQADAVSIVTPTVTHFELAKTLLEAGKHILVEKPMTETSAQAEALVTLSRKHDRVLQVGHVERFNPVFQYLQEVATEPRFIEAHRLSPFPARSTDVGVVLDLMIHDLDVCLLYTSPSPRD